MASALADRGLAPVPVIYADDLAAEVQSRLLDVDGALVWVDPISEGGDRSVLDPMLREVAARGIWVSAHPDVILKMGVKEVLYRTRDLGWGADTHLYPTTGDFGREFPPRLASGPRVLKQNRGNGGIGVWKVELAAPGSSRPGPETLVRVLQARRGSVPKELTLGEFMIRCERYFVGEGRIIDQAFQPRLPDGMIRCYMAQAECVGFGHQLIKALLPPPRPSEGPEAGQPGPRIMHPPDAPQFQTLRRLMETDWVPAMQRLLDIPTPGLPVLWDADFLYGPKTANGEDTYVLCEINVSAVAPFPESAPPRVADATLRCVLAAMQAR